MADKSVITVGNFDGVHLGHRAILARARSIAQSHHVPVIALTFDPFPTKLLRPQHAPARLSDRDQRARLLREAGADQVLVIEPTHDFLALDADTFLRQLVREFSPLAMVEGSNFRFGKGRSGDVHMLAQLAPQLGFDMIVIDPVEVMFGSLSAVPVSSSLVRWLVLAGRVHEAAKCLGRSYELTGRVIRGEQRGRTIGFPTANLDPSALDDRIIPADGVYAGKVTFKRSHDATIELPGAISIGHKPTFGKLQRVIEVHLLNYQGDLYDQNITVRFERWVREQMSFPGVTKLVEQIQRDVQRVEEVAEWSSGRVAK